MTLYLIEDIRENGAVVKRQYIEAATPEEARQKAGKMPTLRRDTIKLRKQSDGRLIPA